MTYKITVAFECKNLKITNVAAMTDASGSKICIFGLVESSKH